jgi:hypothetical protein
MLNMIEKHSKNQKQQQKTSRGSTPWQTYQTGLNFVAGD